MKFHPAPANPFYDNFNYQNRFQSEKGRWTICLEPMIYGVRVKAGITNSFSFALDVCCGADRGQIILIFAVVKYWLEQFDESVSESELKDAFPVLPIKPVYKNPQWHEFIKSLGSEEFPQNH